MSAPLVSTRFIESDRRFGLDESLGGPPSDPKVRRLLLTLKDSLKSVLPWVMQAEGLGEPFENWFRAEDPPHTASGEFQALLMARFASYTSFAPLDFDGLILSSMESAQSRAEALLYTSILHTSLSWDAKPFSERFLEYQGSGSDEVVQGRSFVRLPSNLLCEHQGLLLGWGVYSYKVLQNFAPQMAQRMGTLIRQEIERQVSLFEKFFRDAETGEFESGKRLMKAAHLVHSNLKAFDRSLLEARLIHGSASEVGIDFSSDPARLFRLGVSPNSALDLRVRRVHRIVQATSGSENWRRFHFAAPRALCRDRELLFPKGPCLDDWGARIMHSCELTLGEKWSCLEFLVDEFYKNARSESIASCVRGLWIRGGMRTIVREGLDTLISELLRAEPHRSEASVSEWVHALEKRIEHGLLGCLVQADALRFEGRMVSAARNSAAL